MPRMLLSAAWSHASRKPEREIRPAGAGVSAVQFHVLSFEGPDPYARVGGLATRIEGLTETLAALGLETHLWFVGDPEKPGYESDGLLHLHRWAQWVSRHHPEGVYDGELGKTSEFSRTLPPHLLREFLRPHLRQGGHAVILAEEWQTADAVLHLDWLLRDAELRDHATILWNANNTFGFERIRWDTLTDAAVVTTVSRYMKHEMRREGVNPMVIPNGLASDAFDPPDGPAVKELRRRFRGRTLLTKMARWDPDKRWLATIDLVAEMKRQRWSPLLVARGGSEPHGADVLARARARGLQVVDRQAVRPGPAGLAEVLRDARDADIINLHSYVDPDARRALFRSADAVLANSDHEPFGLVGLEAMAAGGVACTGCSGEDYAVPGQNAIVLETGDPREFMGLFRGVREAPERMQGMRLAGQATAKRYAWDQIVERVLIPRAEIYQRGEDEELPVAALPALSRWSLRNAG
jgi:glycosyltransferase involved in cell wall biosynthesis